MNNQENRIKCEQKPVSEISGGQIKVNEKMDKSFRSVQKNVKMSQKIK